MWYSLFVGLPFFCALLFGAFTAPIGYQGLTQKQFPPKGFKVYNPTKISRGWKANVKSLILLLIPVFFILVSIWGYFQVDNLPHEIPEDYDFSVCKR